MKNAIVICEETCTRFKDGNGTTNKRYDISHEDYYIRELEGEKASHFKDIQNAKLDSAKNNAVQDRNYNFSPDWGMSEILNGSNPNDLSGNCYEMAITAARNVYDKKVALPHIGRISLSDGNCHAFCLVAEKNLQHNNPPKNIFALAEHYPETVVIDPWLEVTSYARQYRSLALEVLNDWTRKRKTILNPQGIAEIAANNFYLEFRKGKMTLTRFQNPADVKNTFDMANFLAETTTAMQKRK